MFQNYSLYYFSKFDKMKNLTKKYHIKCLQILITREIYKQLIWRIVQKIIFKKNFS